jgi:hypothetical protein
LKPTVGMDDNLGVPVHSLVELLVRCLGVLDSNLVRDDEAGLSFPSDDQVAELAVISLDVALACADCQALLRVRPSRVEKDGVGLFTFSNNFPKLKLIIPFAAAASPAPGSLSMPISTLLTVLNPNAEQ